MTPDRSLSQGSRSTLPSAGNKEVAELLFSRRVASFTSFRSAVALAILLRCRTSSKAPLGTVADSVVTLEPGMV